MKPSRVRRVATQGRGKGEGWVGICRVAEPESVVGNIEGQSEHRITRARELDVGEASESPRVPRQSIPEVPVPWRTDEQEYRLIHSVGVLCVLARAPTTNVTNYVAP